MAVFTASGRFKIYKTPHGIKAEHVKSGLGVGGFSHIAIKTLKKAREGLENVEANTRKKHLKELDNITETSEITKESRAAQTAFRKAMEQEFPNGAWSSH